MRFTQPDTLVPDPANPQTTNLFSSRTGALASGNRPGGRI